MRLGLGVGILPTTPKAHAATFATGYLTIADNDGLLGSDSTTTLTITDWTLMSGGNFDVLGMATLTEGVDFVAETSNEVTAANIAAAFDILAEGDFANAVGAVISVAVGGEDDGGELVWSGAGVSPTTAVFTGGFDKCKFLIDGIGFTFPDDVAVGPNAAGTVNLMVTAIENYGIPNVTVLADGGTLRISAAVAGAAGNSITLSVEASGGGPFNNAITRSGATLTGGTDAT